MKKARQIINGGVGGLVCADSAAGEKEILSRSRGREMKTNLQVDVYIQRELRIR